MSMHVMMILHGILMMVIHLMLLPLIDEFTPEVTIVWRLLLLSFVCLVCIKAKMLQYFEGYVAKNSYFSCNPKLLQDTPDLAEDFDSPICLACTTTKISIFTTTKSLFPTNMKLLKIPNNSTHVVSLAQRDNNASEGWCSLVSFGTKGHQ